MTSADDLVKFIIVLWFFLAFIAGLALIWDHFLVAFIPKHSFHTQILKQPYNYITYDTDYNITSL